MTSHRAISVVAVAGLWLHAALAQAQSYCRNYMAEQNNGYAGFYIDVENQVQTGDTLCRLSGLKVILGVGDGQTFTYVTHSGLQYNTEYTATGLLHPSSSEFQVNGVSVGTASGTFTPYQGLFDGNVIPTWAASAAEYAVVVEDVRLVPDHGPARGISFAEEANRPTPLFAFNPAGPRNTPLELAPGATRQSGRWLSVCGWRTSPWHRCAF